MSRSGRAALVTGATGFIGRHVVRRLLADGRRVVALARSRPQAAARDRVARAVGTWTRGHLQVIEGDLVKPDAGLDGATMGHLRETIETVIHCAGEAAFFPEAGGGYRAGDNEGPCRLLEPLHGGRLARWAHLSTAYVCGDRAGTVLESEGDRGQRFRNPYEAAKLESETAVRAAGRRLRLDVRILRPSIVVGPAPDTAGGNPSNLFFGLIRMAAALAAGAAGTEVSVRVPLAPAVPFNIVPVEYVAEAAVVLAEHPDGTGGTFHLVASDPPSQDAMLRMVMACVGLRGVSLVDPRLGPLEAPSPLERTIERMLEGYREYVTQDVRFDDTNARRLLDVAGVPRPSLSAAAFLRLVEQALTARGRTSADGGGVQSDGRR